MYAASLSGNTVYRVELATILPLTLTSFTGQYRNNTAQLNWETLNEISVDRFDVECSADGTSYTYAGTVTAGNTAAKYSFDHYKPHEGRLFYRLKIVDRDGQFRYSNIISLNTAGATGDLVYPNVITDGILRLQLRDGARQLRMVTMNGAVVLQQSLAGTSGRLDIPLDGIAAGMYFVHLEGSNDQNVHKVIVQ